MASLWKAMAAALMVAVICAPASAAYPDRPITMIVPFPAGSPVDQAARYFARILEERLGQPVIVDNKLGAGGGIGTEAVAHARPNGYTMLLTTASSMTTAAALSKSLPYDPIKDFTPVFGANTTGLALNVSSSVPVNSARELVEYARANPNKLSYASTGVGTTTHLAAEMFMQQTGTKMVHIPYKGGPPAAIDLIAGNVHVMFVATGNAQSNAATGKTKVLGVLAADRSPDLPGVPTVAELGLPEIAQPAFWFGVFFPKGTPADIVQPVENALRERLSTEEAKKQLPTMGLVGTLLSREELAARLVDEIKTYSELVKKANIPLQ